MSLKTRVIPCLDVKDGRVVKGVKIRRSRRCRRSGRGRQAPMTPRAPTSSAFSTSPRAMRSAAILLDVVARTAEQLLHAGDRRRRRAYGRRRARADARRRRQGVDQLRGGRRPLDRRAGGGQVRRPGDRRRGRCQDRCRAARARWEIFTHGGRSPTGIDAVEYAREVAALGAGEILLTSMDRDGTKRRLTTWR